MFRGSARTPLCLASALTAVLAVLALAGPPVSAAADEGTALTVPIRIGTYNIVNSASPDEAETAMRRLLPHVDVAGLQEYEPNERLPSLDRLGQVGWGYWKTRYSDPVIYDRLQFQFLSARAATVAAGRMVEDKASSTRLKYRNDTVAAVVRLLHRPTGERLVFINVHPTPGATPKGRPNKLMPKRLAMFKEEIRRTAALAADEQAHGRVFFLGDWNINYRADVQVRHKAFAFRQFKLVGYKSVWAAGMPEIGTQNRALIDGVWATTLPTSAQILTDFPESDHRPAVVTYPLPTA
jgi:hypothetical protein